MADNAVNTLPVGEARPKKQPGDTELINAINMGVLAVIGSLPFYARMAAMGRLDTIVSNVMAGVKSINATAEVPIGLDALAAAAGEAGALINQNVEATRRSKNDIADLWKGILAKAAESGFGGARLSQWAKDAGLGRALAMLGPPPGRGEGGSTGPGHSDGASPGYVSGVSLSGMPGMPTRPTGFKPVVHTDANYGYGYGSANPYAPGGIQDHGFHAPEPKSTPALAWAKSKPAHNPNSLTPDGYVPHSTDPDAPVKKGGFTPVDKQKQAARIAADAAKTLKDGEPIKAGAPTFSPAPLPDKPQSYTEKLADLGARLAAGAPIKNDKPPADKPLGAAPVKSSERPDYAALKAGDPKTDDPKNAMLKRRLAGAVQVKEARQKDEPHNEGARKADAPAGHAPVAARAAPAEFKSKEDREEAAAKKAAAPAASAAAATARPARPVTPTPTAVATQPGGFSKPLLHRATSSAPG